MVAEVAVEKGKKNTPDKLHTLEAYFKLEEKASYKSEFVNGKIIAMAGGTINHGKIGGMLYALLLMLSLDRKEEINVFSNDQKVYIPSFNRSTYTDTCVIVGKTETYKDGNQAILNPCLIVEVASKSTEYFDRTDKFRMYQSLPSFKEYVIVNQQMPIIEVFYKLEEHKWQMTSYVGLDKEVYFETLGLSLKMADIYQTAIDLKTPQHYIEFPKEEA